MNYVNVSGQVILTHHMEWNVPFVSRNTGKSRWIHSLGFEICTRGIGDLDQTKCHLCHPHWSLILCKVPSSVNKTRENKDTCFLFIETQETERESNWQERLASWVTLNLFRWLRSDLAKKSISPNIVPLTVYKYFSCLTMKECSRKVTWWTAESCLTPLKLNTIF